MVRFDLVLVHCFDYTIAEVILGFNLTDVSNIKTHLQSLSNIKPADLVNLVRRDNLITYHVVHTLLYVLCTIFHCSYWIVHVANMEHVITYI